MGKKYWFKFVMIFILSMICSNIPFLMIGMFRGFLPAVLISLWLSSVWSFKDSPVFIAYKTGIVGFFCIVLMELARSYSMIQEIGLKLFWEHVFSYIIWSMFPLIILSISMAVWQLCIILIYKIDLKFSKTN